MNDELRALFEGTRWGKVAARFERLTEAPPDALISNVCIVPFIGARVVIIRLIDGKYEVPGGTREADEGYLDTLRRELLEEAGGRLVDYHPFGAWRCHSAAEKPYRPHLPHPDFYRLAGYGDIELIGQPTSPAGAEQIAAVETVTLEEAAARFTEAAADLADLYRLAAQVREESA